MKMRLLPLGILITHACLLNTSQAAAQSVLPRSAEPGAIERQLKQSTKPTPTPSPHVNPPNMVIAPAPENAASLHLTLHSLEITGATVFTEAQLKPLYADLLGKEITVAQLYTVADRITRMYTDAGYYLSLAVIPPQRAGKGDVTIRVLEGSLSDVVFEGEPVSRDDLTSHWKQQLVSERPANSKTFERLLLLLNDLPGVSAQAFYDPAQSDEGKGVLRIVVDQKQIDAGMSFNNRGTRYIGPLLQNAYLSLNNTLKLQESITLHESTSLPWNEMWYGALDVMIPLNATGTELHLDASRSHSKPGFALKSLDVKSVADRLQFEVSHPLIRSLQQNLTIGGMFDLYNAETDILNEHPNTEDRLRVLRAHGTYDLIEEGGASDSITLEVSQGLDIFDATETGDPLLSRQFGHSDFTKATFNALRLQPLGGNWAVKLAGEGQYAFSQLLSSEEFAYGGSEFGHGYDSSEITGDHGISGLVEINYTHNTNFKYLHMLQYYAFYDAAAVWHINDAFDDESGTSAGLGARAELLDHFGASVEFARPLTHPSYHDNQAEKDWRLFFALTATY